MQVKQYLTLSVLVFAAFIALACGNQLSEAEQHNNAGVELAEQGRFEEAISEYNEAIRIDPRFAEAYSNRGKAYYNMDEYERAIQELDETIRLDPQLAVAYAFRGLAYAMLSEDALAQQDIESAVELGLDRAELEALIQEAKYKR